MTSAPTDLAYAAGVIDSDGYIGVHRSTYGMRVRGDTTQAVYVPRVQVKQVTTEALDLLSDLFGGYRGTGKPTAQKGRPLGVWLVHSAAAGIVCEAVLPYLRIKRAQALNAIEVSEINASSRSAGHRFELPAIVDGEPMITMADAARRLGKRYDVVLQSVRKGNVPHIRTGPRKVLIPESYLETWSARGDRPRRSAVVTDRLEACFLRSKELNRVGI